MTKLTLQLFKKNKSLSCLTRWSISSGAFSIANERKLQVAQKKTFKNIDL